MKRALNWLKGDAAAAAGAGEGPSENDPASGQAISIPVEAIRPNQFQPRRHFDGDELGALAASIRQVGVLQPIMVRPAEDHFELIMGERRWRAAMMAGLQEVPALLRRLPDEAAAVLALVENMQRTDLSFWEEAEGFQRILGRFQITQGELAVAIGRGQSTVANKLRLLRLPDDIKMRARRAGLTERHVRALLKVEDGAMLNRLVDKIVADDLTVRETEALVEKSLAASDGGSQEKRRRGASGLRMIRDVRIMMNTFRQGVEALRKAGLDADMATDDYDEHLTITIRIPKQRHKK